MLFRSGQATEVAINKEGWRDKKRPFTFTSTPDDDFLEFTIKAYTDHDGVTDFTSRLIVGDEFIIDEPWGAIHYKGPGTFIAGGAGITPFLSILRQLEKEDKLAGNTLIFSSLTGKDIILEGELQRLLGDNFIITLTHEKREGYLNGFINREFLQEHVNGYSQRFYVCGPPKMVEDLSEHLRHLGANPNGIVFEK